MEISYSLVDKKVDLTVQIARQFCATMISRGEVVKRVVQESGLTIKWLANKIGISRQQLYLDFANPEMSYDRILAIGKLLHYDFSEEFSDVPAGIVRLLNGPVGASPIQLQECQAKLVEVQGQLIDALQLLDRYKTKYGSDPL